MAPENYHSVESPEHLQELLSKDLNVVSILNFRADWAEPCKDMDQVAKELATAHPKALFLEIEAEALPDISESFDVEAVPFFVVLRGHTLLDRISGAQAAKLAASVEKHVKMEPTQVLSSTSQAPQAPPTSNGAPAEESQEEIDQRCHRIMKQSDVVLFMKGDPERPQCGFSRQIVGLLNQENIQFTTYDILQDEGVRQRLKVLNEWPTFPQLIIKNELIGGLDIVREMIENNELHELLEG